MLYKCSFCIIVPIHWLSIYHEPGPVPCCWGCNQIIQSTGKQTRTGFHPHRGYRINQEITPQSNQTLVFSHLWCLSYISYFTLSIDLFIVCLYIWLLCPTRYKTFVKASKLPLTTVTSRYSDIFLTHVISKPHNSPVILLYTWGIQAPREPTSDP